MNPARGPAGLRPAIVVLDDVAARAERGLRDRADLGEKKRCADLQTYGAFGDIGTVCRKLG